MEDQDLFIIKVDAYLNNPKHQEDYFKEERRIKNCKIGKIG